MVKFEITLPDQIRVAWQQQSESALPVLINDETDEPIDAITTAIIATLLDPGRSTRDQAWTEHGLRISEQHSFPKMRRVGYDEGYQEGYEQGQRERDQDDKRLLQPWFVYLIRGLEHHKIGIATNVERRLQQLKSTGGASSLEIVTSAMFPDRATAGSVERRLHSLYSEKREHGEWFSLTSKDTDDIEKVLGHLETAAEKKLTENTGMFDELMDALSGIPPVHLLIDEETATESLAAD